TELHRRELFILYHSPPDGTGSGLPNAPCGTGIMLPRAIPLRRIRPVGRPHLSAGLAEEQGAGGGLRTAVREGQRRHGLARLAAGLPRRRRFPRGRRSDTP